MTLPTSGSNDMCLAPFPRYYPTTFTVYMTACNLEKSVIFDIQLGLKDTEALRARVTFPNECELERFQTAKVTLNHSMSLTLVEFDRTGDFLLVFHCNYISNLYCF